MSTISPIPSVNPSTVPADTSAAVGAHEPESIAMSLAPLSQVDTLQITGGKTTAGASAAKAKKAQRCEPGGPSKADYVSNKDVLREFEADGTPVYRLNDRILVERQANGTWKPVAVGDRTISTNELGQSFGLWKDREVTSGHLWWKKVQRPKDGKAQGDEVVPMAKVLNSHFENVVRYYPNESYTVCDEIVPIKSKLTLTPDGGKLHTDWRTLGRHDVWNVEWDRNASSYLV